MSELFNFFPGNTLIDSQVFTANGTWTKPAGVLDTDTILLEMWGGGGGGGKHSPGNAAYGGGGGGYVRLRLPASAFGATEAVVIGAGGAGTATNGNTAASGGSSSVAGFSAQGGSGGGAVNTIGAPGRADSFTETAPTAGSVAPTYAAGQAVHSGTPTSVFGAGAGGYADGSNIYGPGLSLAGGDGGAASNANTTAAGNPGSAPGGGGGARNSSAAATGGNGARGEVRIKVYRGQML